MLYNHEYVKLNGYSLLNKNYHNTCTYLYTFFIKIGVSVFEMPTRVTRVNGACAQKYSSYAVPNVQGNKQKGDVLWLLMETNGIGKRDSVLSKIIKSLWKIYPTK